MGSLIRMDMLSSVSLPLCCVCHPSKSAAAENSGPARGRWQERRAAKGKRTMDTTEIARCYCWVTDMDFSVICPKKKWSVHALSSCSCFARLGPCYSCTTFVIVSSSAPSTEGGRQGKEKVERSEEKAKWAEGDAGHSRGRAHFSSLSSHRPTFLCGQKKVCPASAKAATRRRAMQDCALSRIGWVLVSFEDWPSVC